MFSRNFNVVLCFFLMISPQIVFAQNTLSIVVKDSSNYLVKSVRVELEYKNTKRIAYTGDDGFVTYKNLEDGEDYTVMFNHPHYNIQTLSGVLRGNTSRRFIGYDN